MLEVSAHPAEALLACRQPKSHADGARRRASRWLAHGHASRARRWGRWQILAYCFIILLICHGRADLHEFLPAERLVLQRCGELILWATHDRRYYRSARHPCQWAPQEVRCI